MDRKTQQELHDLLSALLDGALSSEEQDRLGNLLRQHPQARDLYLAYFDLHASLALGADAADLSRLLPLAAVELPPREVAPDPAAPLLLRRRRTRRIVRVALGLSALAAGVLLAVFLWPRPAAVVPPAKEEPEDRTVAVLLQALGAEWESDEPVRRPGTPLAPGRLRLKSGLIHIEFYSGALVILQGPADFELIASTEAYCARGKLWATVPPLAQGFTVGSPKYDLVDRGTEFGLDVGAGGQTEVHVFHGKVDLYKPGADREAAAPQALKTGQGVRLEEAGEARPIPSNPAAFPSAQRLAERLQAERERRRQEWLEAGKELRRDPGLLVYYPFQDEEPWSRTLRDQAAVRPGPGAHNGTIVGCTWTTGRWPGKRSLEFKQVSDRVRLHVPGEFDALTLMAWVRADALPNRFNALFMTDSWDDFQAGAGRSGARAEAGSALLHARGLHARPARAVDPPGRGIRPGRRPGRPLRQRQGGRAGGPSARRGAADRQRGDRQLERHDPPPQPSGALLHRLRGRVPAVRAGAERDGGREALRERPAAIVSRLRRDLVRRAVPSRRNGCAEGKAKRSLGGQHASSCLSVRVLFWDLVVTRMWAIHHSPRPGPGDV
jgi:hypothetical protein